MQDPFRRDNPVL